MKKANNYELYLAGLTESYADQNKWAVIVANEEVVAFRFAPGRHR
jgi:hypothetical protein